MSTRTLAAATITLSAVPLALGALLLRGRLLQRRQRREGGPYQAS